MPEITTISQIKKSQVIFMSQTGKASKRSFEGAPCNGEPSAYHMLPIYALMTIFTQSFPIKPLHNYHYIKLKLSA